MCYGKPRAQYVALCTWKVSCGPVMSFRASFEVSYCCNFCWQRAAVRVLKLRLGGFLSESTEWGSGLQPCSSFCFVKAILTLCNKEELVGRQVLSEDIKQSQSFNYSLGTMTCSSNKDKIILWSGWSPLWGGMHQKLPGFIRDEARDIPGWAALAGATGQLPWPWALLASVAAL